MSKTLATIKVASTPAERMVQHIELSHAAMTKAAAFEAQVQKQAAEVQAAIPQLCDVLIAAELIRPEERVKLASTLSDPVAALHMFRTFANRYQADGRGSRLGAGVDAQVSGGSAVKQASVRPFSQQPTAAKASASVLFRGLGLPVPADLQ